jgi:hypothetical protein
VDSSGLRSADAAVQSRCRSSALPNCHGGAAI